MPFSDIFLIRNGKFENSYIFPVLSDNHNIRFQISNGEAWGNSSSSGRLMVGDIDVEIALVAVKGVRDVGQDVVVPEGEPALVQRLP